MGDRDHELQHELDRFDWHHLDYDPPIEGELVIATDGEARWMDMMIMAFYDTPGRGMRWQDRIATHWHGVREIPDDIRSKPKPVEPEIKF